MQSSLQPNSGINLQQNQMIDWKGHMAFDLLISSTEERSSMCCNLSFSVTDLVLRFPTQVPSAPDLPELLHAARLGRREAPLPVHHGAGSRPLLVVARLSSPKPVWFAELSVYSQKLGL